jgi:hypothetical protein
MKNKVLTISILTIISAFALNAYAVSQNSNAGTGNQIQQQTQTANQGEDSQVQAQINQQTQSGTNNQAGTGTQTQQQTQQQSQSGSGTGNQTQNQGEVQGQVKAQQGQVNAEQYRNTVADSVQSLLQVANRQGGIGIQVKAIAQQQSQSAETAIKAMENVQTRSKVKAFFLGSDYKNLGTLRSEMVQTRNRLEQLNTLMENVQNEGDKIELQNQVQTLEQEQVKIESFIKAQEGKFSLFGWLAKMFNK